MGLWNRDALLVVENFVVLPCFNRGANEIDIGNALFDASVDLVVWISGRGKIDFRIEGSDSIKSGVGCHIMPPPGLSR